jgi:hypothetical protein
VGAGQRLADRTASLGLLGGFLEDGTLEVRDRGANPQVYLRDPESPDRIGRQGDSSAHVEAIRHQALLAEQGGKLVA